MEVLSHVDLLYTSSPSFLIFYYCPLYIFLPLLFSRFYYINHSFLSLKKYMITYYHSCFSFLLNNISTSLFLDQSKMANQRLTTGALLVNIFLSRNLFITNIYSDIYVAILRKKPHYKLW